MNPNTRYTHIAAAIVLALMLGTTASASSPKQPAISKAAAEKIALAQVANGHIKSAELENEMHTLVWSFDITQPGTTSITEILVDANTGKIVATQHENLKQQAAETAADKAAVKGSDEHKESAAEERKESAAEEAKEKAARKH